MNGLKILLISLAVCLCLFASSESTDRLQFELMADGVIKQDITRAAIVADGLIFYSTMEDYISSRPSKTRLVVINSDNQVDQFYELTGSNEIRYAVTGANGNELLLATSLDPKLYWLSRAQKKLKQIFAIEGASGWFHQIAYAKGYVYALLSHPNPVVERYRGIIKVNVNSGEHTVIPFVEPMLQGYGGVQSIDPAGRIWFYRAYPFRQYWHDDGGQRGRTLTAYSDWEVDTWEEFSGKYFVILVKNNEYKKICININTLAENEDCQYSNQDLHQHLLPLDYYQQHDALRHYYVNPGNNSIYWWTDGRFTRLDVNGTGEVTTAGKSQQPQEFPLIWSNSEHGDLTAIVGHEDSLTLWAVGAKQYSVQKSGLTPRILRAPGDNLSFSRINNLVASNGTLYGSGLYTHANMFAIDVDDFTHPRELPNAVIGKEGQVNTLGVGLDGNILGGVYPDSALFSYDPHRPWVPGNNAQANPRPLGEINAYNQMRPGKIYQSLNGSVYAQSVSDYSGSKVHALAVVDVVTGNMWSLNDTDHQLPPIVDVVPFENGGILVSWLENETSFIGLYDEENIKLLNSKSLDSTKTSVLQTGINDPSSAGYCSTLLGLDKDLFRVNRNLELKKITQASESIHKIIFLDCQRVILLGPKLLAVVDVNSGEKMQWTYFPGKGNQLCSNVPWCPSAISGEYLYIADGVELWRTKIPVF